MTGVQTCALPSSHTECYFSCENANFGNFSIVVNQKNKKFIQINKCTKAEIPLYSIEEYKFHKVPSENLVFNIEARA